MDNIFKEELLVEVKRAVKAKNKKLALALVKYIKADDDGLIDLSEDKELVKDLADLLGKKPNEVTEITKNAKESRSLDTLNDVVNSLEKEDKKAFIDKLANGPDCEFANLSADELEGIWERLEESRNNALTMFGG